MARSKTGRRWVHRGDDTRMVSRDDLGSLIGEGWRMGRKATAAGEQHLPPEALVDLFFKAKN